MENLPNEMIEKICEGMTTGNLMDLMNTNWQFITFVPEFSKIETMLE